MGGEEDSGEGAAHLFVLLVRGSLSTSSVHFKTVVSLFMLFPIFDQFNTPPLFRDSLEHFFQHPSSSTHSGDLKLA